jgi:serine/threonine-protein kinase
MSPEQVEAHPLDARADVFAAGVVLHEALTGQRLFHGGNEFAVMKRVLKGPIPLPSSLSPGVPPDLDAVVLQAVDRSVRSRFSSAAAFKAALEQAMPPASAADVAAWVVAASGPTLASRKRELEKMVARPAAVSTRPPAPVAASAPPVVDDGPVSIPGVRRRGPLLVYLAIGLATLAFVGAALHFSHHP